MRAAAACDRDGREAEVPPAGAERTPWTQAPPTGRGERVGGAPYLGSKEERTT